MKKLIGLILVLALSLGLLIACAPAAETAKLYRDFTPSEAAKLVELFGERIPFLPNDEYYFSETENGIEYYTVGNTAEEFSAYMELFSEYTFVTIYNEDGVSHSVYSKGEIAIDFSSYIENEKFVVKLLIYTVDDNTNPPSGGDNPPAGGDDNTDPPSGGDNPPSGGDDNTDPPSGGDNPPAGGDDNTNPPSGGDNPPSGGDDNDNPPTEDNNPLKNGARVVIAAPAYGKLLSMTKTGYYNIGVDYVGTNYSVAGNDEIFTVTVNADGTYTFTSLSGKVLALADSNNSLNDTGTNTKWTLEDVSGSDGLYLVKNVGRGNYLEWYAEKNNWSTYTSAKDDQFHIAFYALDGGSTPPSGDEGDTPSDTPSTSLEILNALYALGDGESLTGSFTLTGVITALDSYNNPTIVVDGYSSKPVYCYKLVDTRFVVGATITVTADTMKNYQGTYEFMNCTLDSITLPSGGNQGGSGNDEGDSGDSKFTYNGFTSSEEALLNQYIGATIPFIPNNEYYLEGWDEEKGYGYEYGFCFYTIGNTQNEFTLYRATLGLSGYELTEEYEDDWGDTCYIYTKGDIVIDMCFYESDDGYIVLIYIYSETLSLEPDYGEDGGDVGGGDVGGEGTDTPVGTVTDLKDGDKVVIAAPYYGVILSMNKVATHYNEGISYIDGRYNTVTNNEIFVVTVNNDGTYTFTSLSGKVLALASSYNSLSDTGTNTKWTISAVSGEDGLFLVKNTGRGNYLEWYAEKDNWSTYTSAGNNQFYLAFYAVDNSGGFTGEVLSGSESGSGSGSGGTTTDANIITNEEAGLPSDDGDGIIDVDFTTAEQVKDVTDQGYYEGGCPTTGSPKVLVIPVQFSDALASSKGYTIEALKAAFLEGGKNDYYSLYDYYYISSGGKLTLDITVLDEWFTPKNNSTYYKNQKMDYYGNEVDIGDQMIMDEALAYLDAQGYDLSEYDSDGNGMIDAVVMINTLDIDGEQAFHWAYRYWNLYTDDEGYYYEYDKVSANDYVWASFAFLHDNGENYDDTTLMNTYTFIHEFAHILGADDYYDTAYVEHPMDGHDMMDMMLGDHSAFTKINLGWITSSRLIVTGSSVTVTLDGFVNSGDTIILANDWDEALGAYQEYYIIVYYTADTLNNPALGAGIFEGEGIVVYHINASLYTETEDGKTYYDIYYNNTNASDEYGTEENLIELVESADGDYLYEAGEELSASIADDSGEALGYIFEVVSLGDSATLNFTKV